MFTRESQTDIGEQWVQLQVETSMINLLSQFLKDESGATAIEYGLIAAGIAVAIIAAVNTLGGTLNTTFDGVNTSINK